MKNDKNKLNIIGIIPARMGSSRFPGKPLALIFGKAMIYHVYFRSQLCKRLNGLFIATPDQEIIDYCEQHQMAYIITSHRHETAPDRVAEAMLKIEKKFNKRVDILVMIQGDEPMIYPEMIELAIQPLIKDESILISNLVTPLKSLKEFDDPNEVKVVMDRQNFAMYFSREPIPSRKKGNHSGPGLKQVCVIPFRRAFLLKFNRMKRSPLEIVESVDMLRCLENDYPVKLVRSEFNSYSVDTKKDLFQVRRMMKSDRIVGKYLLKVRSKGVKGEIFD